MKIGDFGLVTTENADGVLNNRTADVGTRSYMAPEQVRIQTPELPQITLQMCEMGSEMKLLSS